MGPIFGGDQSGCKSTSIFQFGCCLNPKGWCFSASLIIHEKHPLEELGMVILRDFPFSTLFQLVWFLVLFLRRGHKSWFVFCCNCYMIRHTYTILLFFFI